MVYFGKWPKRPAGLPLGLLAPPAAAPADDGLGPESDARILFELDSLERSLLLDLAPLLLLLSLSRRLEEETLGILILIILSTINRVI